MILIFSFEKMFKWLSWGCERDKKQRKNKKNPVFEQKQQQEQQQQPLLAYKQGPWTKALGWFIIFLNSHYSLNSTTVSELNQCLWTQPKFLNSIKVLWCENSLEQLTQISRKWGVSNFWNQFACKNVLCVDHCTFGVSEGYYYFRSLFPQNGPPNIQF